MVYYRSTFRLAAFSRPNTWEKQVKANGELAHTLCHENTTSYIKFREIYWSFPGNPSSFTNGAQQLSIVKPDLILTTLSMLLQICMPSNTMRLNLFLSLSRIIVSSNLKECPVVAWWKRIPLSFVWFGWMFDKSPSQDLLCSFKTLVQSFLLVWPMYFIGHSPQGTW